MDYKNTDEYNKIISAVMDAGDCNIKCIFLRYNGESQAKDVRFVSHDYSVEWIETQLEAYWEEDEVVVFVSVNGSNVLWVNSRLCEKRHLEMLKDLMW